MKCASGQHDWLNTDSAHLCCNCCNGWHRELRLHADGGPKPDDCQVGRTYLTEGVMVWVPNAPEVATP